MSIRKKWRVIRSEYIIRRPWATLRKDVCETPSGVPVPEYYVLEYPDWVNVVGVTNDKKFVLIRQYRHGAGEAFLEIPGGVVDSGESPLEAAKREMKEETGFEFKSFKELCQLYPNPATSTNRTTTYLALEGTRAGAQNLDDQEEIEVRLVTIDELKELLAKNALGQALHVSAIYYALKALSIIK